MHLMSRLLFLLLAVIAPLAASDPVSAAGDHAVASVPPLWTVAPFALLLVAIAVMPIAKPHFWHRWYPAVALGLGAVTAGYYLATQVDGLAAIVHVGFEY